MAAIFLIITPKKGSNIYVSWETSEKAGKKNDAKNDRKKRNWKMKMARMKTKQANLELICTIYVCVAGKVRKSNENIQAIIERGSYTYFHNTYEYVHKKGNAETRRITIRYIFWGETVG